MYELTATFTSANTIIVISNTTWSCEVFGNNFTLSKYSGVGDDEINIIIPSHIPFADGSVLFTYGDDKCRKEELTIFTNNNYYIVTEPSYITCENKKVINLFYSEPNEVFYVNVSCFDGWVIDDELTNVKYIKDENSIMIISPSDCEDGELTIVPTHYGDENNIIVNLMKK